MGKEGKKKTDIRYEVAGHGLSTHLRFAGLTLMVGDADLVEQTMQLGNAAAHMLAEAAGVHGSGADLATDRTLIASVATRGGRAKRTKAITNSEERCKKKKKKQQKRERALCKRRLQSREPGRPRSDARGRPLLWRLAVGLGGEERARMRERERGEAQKEAMPDMSVAFVGEQPHSAREETDSADARQRGGSGRRRRPFAGRGRGRARRRAMAELLADEEARRGRQRGVLLR